MAKNKNYKQVTPQAKKEKKKTGKYLTVTLSVIAALCVVGVIAAAIVNNERQNEPARHSSTVICSISYPDLQESGEIWQTGGMHEHTATNLREALEDDFSDILTAAFDADGKLVGIDSMTAADGNHFLIYQVTNRGSTLLEKIPEQITLEEAASYEIVYVDKDGNQISKLD